MQMRTNYARRILITLAACVALLAIPALASANKNLRAGFLDNAYVASDPAGFWSDAVALNVGFMRFDLQWAHMAVNKPKNPRNVEDPAYFWAASDNFVTQAAQHGLQDRVMFTLWSSPKWASSLKASGSTADMPKIDAWRAFVHVVATRYSGKYTPPGATTPLPRVVSFETWNEPNASFALRPQIVNGKAVSPGNYVKLLNALRSEVTKAVSFKPTFVAGALYKQGGPRSVTPINFLRGSEQDESEVHRYRQLRYLHHVVQPDLWQEAPNLGDRVWLADAERRQEPVRRHLQAAVAVRLRVLAALQAATAGRAGRVVLDP